MDGCYSGEWAAPRTLPLLAERGSDNSLVANMGRADGSFAALSRPRVEIWLLQTTASATQAVTALRRMIRGSGQRQQRTGLDRWNNAITNGVQWAQMLRKSSAMRFEITARRGWSHLRLYWIAMNFFGLTTHLLVKFALSL